MGTKREHGQREGALGEGPSSAPAPPQGAPGGSGQRGTLRARPPGHWGPRHCASAARASRLGSH
eukprot:scaffold23052_cov21-Phaeocystis_antarctica.AAC.1